MKRLFVPLAVVMAAAVSVLVACTQSAPPAPTQAPPKQAVQPTQPPVAKPTAESPQPQAAAKYPARNIEIIVGYAPGGGQDTVARAIAAYAQERWKVPVTVTNKPGGGGWVGAAAAFQAPPDGYTMFVNGPTSYYSLAVAKNPPFKATEGTPVGCIVVNPLVFAVKGDAPWNTLKEAVEEARKSPENFKGSGSGLAGLTMFAGAKVWIQAGIDPARIPIMVFDGGVLSNQAVAGGSAQFSVNNLQEGLTLYQAKKLKFLAVTTPQRFPEAPEVPTGKEAGFDQFDTVGFSGMWGPSNLPDQVVAAWDGIIKEASQDPKFLASLQKAGFISGYKGPKEFRDFIMSTYNWAAELGKKLKIEL